jgi:hypothetical protein
LVGVGVGVGVGVDVGVAVGVGVGLGDTPPVQVVPLSVNDAGLPGKLAAEYEPLNPKLVLPFVARLPLYETLVAVTF